MASRAGTPPTSCCGLQHAQASLAGFLQAGEFTVLSVQSYDLEVHFSFSDLAMDSHAAPSLLHIRREPFKTDPFRQGADIFVGATNTSTSVRTFAQAKDPCMIPEAGQGGLTCLLMELTV